MELKDVLQKRRSVRKFTAQSVPDEYINELMHAAMSGPSACNRQPWEFYVVTNPDTLKRLRTASHFSNIAAPLAIVVCGDLSRALPAPLADYWIQDCSAATENILLRAADLGLGAVWCGVHLQKRAEKQVADIIGLGEHQLPLNIIYAGFPADTKDAGDYYDETRIHHI